MRRHTPTTTDAGKGEPRLGLPGGAKERGERIKAAIKADRETLRRPAK